MPEIIQTKLISQHYNNSLADYFGINKMGELISWEYNWPSLRNDVEGYVKDYDICLGSKTVRHKPYSDLQLLPLQHINNNLALHLENTYSPQDSYLQLKYSF